MCLLGEEQMVLTTQGKNIRKPETEPYWICWLYQELCPHCCVALLKLWHCSHGRSCVTEGEGGYQSALLPSSKLKLCDLHRAPLEKPSKCNLFPWSTNNSSVVPAWIWGETCVASAMQGIWSVGWSWCRKVGTCQERQRKSSQTAHLSKAGEIRVS